MENDRLQEKVFEGAGCNIHYWLGGPDDKPLIVMLHGATMDHRMFCEQAKALQPAYRVLLWDMRGHGRSQPFSGDFSLKICVQDLLGILDELSVQKVILLGQSLGGYVAQMVYEEKPELVQAMIMIDTTPISKAYSFWDVWALRVSLPLIDLWPYSHFIKTVAKTTALCPENQAYALEAIKQIPRREFLKIWKAATVTIDTKGKPDLQINVPLLLLQGDQDQSGTIKRDMPLWARSEPGVTYQIIPDAGHNSNQDNPQAANSFIQEFLEEIFQDSAQE